MVKQKISTFLWDKKGWIPLFFLLLFILSIIFLPQITTIVIVALFLAYAISPLVNFLSNRFKVHRGLATSAIMFLIGIIIVFLFFLVIPVVVEKITIILKNLPAILLSFVDWVYEVSERLGIDLKENATLSKEMLINKLSETSSPIIKSLTSFFGILFKQTFSILSFFVNFVILTVITFFTSYKFPRIKKELKSLIPPSHNSEIMIWVKRFDTVLSGFIRGQLTVCFVLGALYSLGFVIAGVDNSGSLGAMIGMLCIVPYIGLITGFIIAALLALTSGGTIMLLKVLIVFVIIQTLDAIFITPNIMGKKVGISPVFVIIALFAGAEIGGLLGILIAIPSFAIIKLISEDIIEKYKKSTFYQEG